MLLGHLSRPRTYKICTSKPRHLLLAVYLDDFYAFDLPAMSWSCLSVADNTQHPPGIRGHGFTSEEGRLYVHGGYNGTGDLEANVVGCKKRVNG